MLTDNYYEDEIQALIALDEIASPLNNPNDAPLAIKRMNEYESQHST